MFRRWAEARRSEVFRRWAEDLEVEASLVFIVRLCLKETKPKSVMGIVGGCSWGGTTLRSGPGSGGV